MLSLLHVQRGDGGLPSVTLSGLSNGADMAIQFHIAYSGIVAGVCGFSGQPYYCAASRFAGEALVPARGPCEYCNWPRNAGVAVPVCVDAITGNRCPNGTTVRYDHCKHHPEFVDVAVLAAARRVAPWFLQAPL